MATGFMSAVARRLFHSKGKDKSPRPDLSIADRSSTPSSPCSPVSPSAHQKQKHLKDRGNTPQSDTPPVKKRQQGNRKSPLFSSLRKKTRPLSCIAARSDSPPRNLLEDLQNSSQTDARTPKQRDKKEEEKSSSSAKQRKDKKPRRPLSCIVQPPSPQLLPSVNSSQELLPSHAEGEAGSERKENSPQAVKTQPRPRPVSCFVEAPAGRSPPPYFRRTPGASPQLPESVEEYVPFQVGSPQRSPPSYLEASRRSPKLPPQQALSPDSRSHGRLVPCGLESAQQPVMPAYADSTALTYYPEHLQEPMSACPDPVQQPMPCAMQSPRQSTPVMDSRQPAQRSGRCGNVNCLLDPCPYQYQAQPQAINGYSYDLKTYFPPASPARRYGRPQSACFLCEPQPCCVDARTCRPKSQCYFPDCNLPWSDPNPPLTTVYQELQTLAKASAEGDQVLQAQESVYTPQPSASASRDVEGFEQTPTSPKGLPPRPAKRTLTPRPKSSYILSTESDCSPMSSPAPSPRPRRFPLKKYRSADCLDRVDEVESLDVCPPPAKPLSYFTDSDSPQPTSSQKKEEIFTSVEMLEKLGQPRARSHLPRPVSCFVGSSADESGYLSNATLGGSGWLGGLSASTGDILEMLQDGDEPNVADDELSFERASSFRKAWSVCSLLRQDSIQDRSFTVMRRRRQKMKDRRHTNQRSSSTETDEGVGEKEGASASSLLQAEGKEGESATATGLPLDKKLRVHGSRGTVMRLHSAHMKAWQIRLRRKQMMKKRRSTSTEHLGSRIETLV